MSDQNSNGNPAPMPAFAESNDAPLFALEDTNGASSAQPQPLLFGGSSHAGAIGTTGASSNTNVTHAFATFGAPLPQHHGSGSSQQAALLAGSPAAPGSTSMPSPGGSQLQPQLLDSEGHVVSLSTPDAQNRNIYVASLPNNFSDDNLRDLFLPFGGIVSSKMFNNDGRPGSHGRAYGFVMFAEEGSVQKAIDALVGAVVGSQRIQVRRAKPTARGPSQPGSANPTPMNSSSQAVLTPQQPTGVPSPPQQQHHVPMQQQPPQQQQQPPQQPPQQQGGSPGVLMIQPGGTVTLQHVGSNALGQPIFLTPTGQQVVLAAPSAPLSQGVAPAMQPQQSPQAFSSGNQAPHLVPMGAGGSGAQTVLMPGGNNNLQQQQQGGSPAGGFFFQPQR